MIDNRYHFNNLQEFISRLDKENELKTINVAVSSDLEITEFYLREIEKGEEGKALLFTNVDNQKVPVLINALGSFKRLKIAFGGWSLDDLAAELKSFLEVKPPTGLSDKINTLMTLSKVRNFLPKKVKSAACQEVVYTGDEIDITKFPILKTWPQDGGPFITLPLVYTKDLEGTAKNCGMYRMQIYDKKTTGMHWQIHHDASNFHHDYRKANKRMEVAVAIGGDPSLVFSAIAPLPPKIFEMLIAGFIRNKPVPMVKCKTVDIEVPAEAEIIIEGYVEPHELRSEGPFGDHTGYYTLEEDYPVFHITAITTRKNPVYMTTVVGRSPQEDCYFGGKATERIFLPLFQMISHDVVDMLLPWDGCFHNCNILSMKKRFPMQGRRLMSQVWGQGQASTCKSIITVDEDIKLSDDETFLHYILDNLSIKHNVYITEGIVDALDHSSYQWAYGGKIGIDLTKAILGEAQPNPNEHITYQDFDDEKVLNTFQKFHNDVLEIRQYGMDLKNRVILIKLNKKQNGKIAKQLHDNFLKSDIVNAATILFVVDEKNDLYDGHKLMWRLLNNTDWQVDVYFDDKKEKMTIDSTSKIKEDGFNRRWPDDLSIPENIIKRVSEKTGKL